MATYKDKMAQKTQGMRSVADIRSEVEAASKRSVQKPATKPEAPKAPTTAPGLTGALAAANQTILELREELASGSELDVDKMLPNPWQPRKVFDPIELDELSQSIANLGQIQPIAVRRSPAKPGYYEIIVGERRVRAHKLLGKTKIRAVLVDLNDGEMALWALSENMDRTDLSDYEICKAARSIETMFNTRSELATSLGKSRSHLYRYFSFEKLPPWVLQDLEQNPRLITCSTADELTQLLKSADDAELIFKTLWAELKAAEVDQAKLPKMLNLRLKADEREGSVTGQEKLFKAGKAAGIWKKDGKNLTIKLHTKYLSQDQETKLRTLISELLT